VLNAVTSLYTAPQANGKAYGGKWANTNVSAIDEFDRGGANRGCAIIQTLTKVSEVANSTALLALTPRVHKKNTITHPMELNQGEHDLYEYFYENLDTNAETVLTATITDKQLLVGLALGGAEPTDWQAATGYSAGDIRENPADGVVYIARANHTSAAAFVTDRREGLFVPYWTYVDRDYRENKDATATFVVTLRKTAYIMTGSEESKWQNATKSKDEKETVTYPNVDGYYAQIALDDAKTNAADMTAATPAAPANHVLDTVVKGPSGDGKYNVVRVTVNAGGSVAEAWPNTAKDYDVTFTAYRRVADTAGTMVEQKRIWIGNESRRHLILQSAASSHCSGGIDFPRAGWNTSYYPSGPGRYIAIKYTYVTEGAWEDE